MRGWIILAATVAGGLALATGARPSRPGARPALGWRSALPAPSGPAVEVPGALTPLSADAAGDVIAESYGAVTREEPTEQIVALLKAQSGFETGRWRSMHSHNFGNVTHTGAGPYWARTVTEFLPEPTVKRMKFRAYDSAPQGADDWIGLLERRYPAAWAVLQGSADPRSFVEALKAGRYFTGPLPDYAAGVSSLFREFTNTGRVFA